MLSSFPQIKITIAVLAVAVSLGGLRAEEARAITEPGRYFVDHGNVRSAVGTASPAELQFIVDGRPLPAATVKLTGPNQLFTVDLGLLAPGDSVSAVVKGGALHHLTWPLVCRPSYYSSGYPDPQEIPTGTASPLSGLTALRDDQPRLWFWRGESMAMAGGYRSFVAGIGGAEGYSVKLDNGEIRARPMRPLAARYAKEHPEQIAMMHYNARYAMVLQDPDFARYSPAHWLYYVGCSSTAPLTANGTELAMGRPSDFREHDVVALIPIGPNGEKRWTETEYVEVKAITSHGLELAQRGLLRTKAHAFAAGTYVAPAVTGDPGNKGLGYAGQRTILWYNLSTVCPLDEHGRNCGDVTVQYLSDLFRAGGPGEFLHGLDFDVLFGAYEMSRPRVYNFNPRTGRTIDANVDGVGDGAYGPEGENLCRLGIYDFVRKLRLAFGPNRILTTDGDGAVFPAFPQLFNGIESETLSWVFDYYSAQWADDFNYWQYWQQHAQPQPHYNYLVPKYPWFERTYPDKVADLPDLTRLQNGAAAMLNIGVTKMGPDPAAVGSRMNTTISELIGVPEAKGAWLGRPVEDLRRLALSAPALPGVTGDNAQGWTGAPAQIKAEDGGLHLWSAEAPHGASRGSLVIRSKPFLVPAGDVVVQCDLRGAPLEFLPSGTPRYVFCDALGRKEDPYNKRHFRQQALVDASGFTHLVFYFRQAGPATIQLEFEVEGPQDVWLKDLCVSSGPDVMVRAFEHGAVLTNPGLTPWTADVAQLWPERRFALPGKSEVLHQITVRPHSAEFLVRQP